MKGMHRAAAVLLAFSTTLVMPAMAADGGSQMYPDGAFGPNTGKGYQMFPDGKFGPRY